MSVFLVGKLKLGVNFAGPELLEWSTREGEVSRVPANTDNYKILDIKLKNLDKVISTTSSTFGLYAEFGAGFPVALGWVSAISLDGPNELIPNGESKSQFKVFGYVSSSNLDPESSGNKAHNELIKRIKAVSESWPFRGRYNLHSAKTIVIRDEDLDLDKITGSISSRSVELSADVLNAITRRAWFEHFEKGGRKYESTFKVTPTGNVTQIQDPGNEGLSQYSTSADVEVVVPSAFTWEQDLDIYYDDEKEKLSFELKPDVDSEEALLFQYIKERNDELTNVAIRRSYGEDVKVDVDTEHPTFNADGAYQEQYDMFKKSFDKAAARVNSIKIGSMNDQLKANDPTLTDEQLVTKKEDALAAADGVESGSTGWQKVWDSLTAVAGWAGDTVREWGPVGVVGAYAGYETVKAAKKNNMLVWMAVGLGAIVLLK